MATATEVVVAQPIGTSAICLDSILLPVAVATALDVVAVALAVYLDSNSVVVRMLSDAVAMALVMRLLDSALAAASVAAVPIVRDSKKALRKVVSTLHCIFSINDASLRAGDNRIGNDDNQAGGRGGKCLFLDSIDCRPSAGNGFVIGDFVESGLVDILGFEGDDTTGALGSKRDFEPAKSNTVEGTVENDVQMSPTESTIATMISKALVAMSGGTL